MSFELLTTNQAARILGVSRPLIVQWIDSGKLRGYRIPGSTSRRVPRDALVEFASKYGIPLFNETGRRILIVDDEEEFAEALRKGLEAAGWEVETATDGFEAGKLLSDFRPWVVLLDIHLKEIDGRKVCEMIRRDPVLANIRILGISGYLDEEEAKLLKSNGFDDFLKKPFPCQELLNRLQALERPQNRAVVAQGTAQT